MMKLTTLSPVYLAIFLLALVCFNLAIIVFGYIFVPANVLVSSTISAVIVVLLTINGVKNRNEKTRATVVFSALLPLIAILYYYVKSILIDATVSEKDVSIFVVYIYIILICSMIIFFLCGRGNAVKIGLGVTYSILLIPISLISFIVVMFSGFSENTVVESSMSPNSVYLAEVIDNDQGALGGATMVTVTRQNRNYNLLIGELKIKPKIVYTGDWSEFDGIEVLHWETDKILYINGGKYEIK